MLTLHIAASEWIKHLRMWRWQDIELFELGLSARTEPAAFARTYYNRASFVTGAEVTQRL
jgi:hypothetical protein